MFPGFQNSGDTSVLISRLGTFWSRSLFRLCKLSSLVSKTRRQKTLPFDLSGSTTSSQRMTTKATVPISSSGSRKMSNKSELTMSLGSVH